VPDVYQGQELWDLSLVDPDNRRPVDFAQRADLLDEMTRRWNHAGPEDRTAFARRQAESPDDPRLKLFVTWRTLQTRREHRTLFQDGEYVPLRVEGARAEHVIAFQRRPAKADRDAPFAVVIAPRFLVDLKPFGADDWQDTAVLLEPFERQRLHHEFTDATHEGTGRLDLAEFLADFPVALLIQASDSTSHS
jgi:(1->4)-alpha-D-glucan 1-alpha-D-glucosylmutase